MKNKNDKLIIEDFTKSTSRLESLKENSYKMSSLEYLELPKMSEKPTIHKIYRWQEDYYRSSPFYEEITYLDRRKTKVKKIHTMWCINLDLPQYNEMEMNESVFLKNGKCPFGDVWVITKDEMEMPNVRDEDYQYKIDMADKIIAEYEFLKTPVGLIYDEE